jgi:hypothetical protein
MDDFLALYATEGLDAAEERLEHVPYLDDSWVKAFNKMCSHGHARIVETMLDMGFKKFHHGFAYACKHARVDVVRLLLEQNLDTKTLKFGLLKACDNRHIHIIGLIACHYDYDPVLMIQNVCRSGDLEMVMYVENTCINVLSDGFVEACRVSRPHISAYLLPKITDLECINRGFQYACTNGDMKIITQLLDKVADLTVSHGFAQACMYDRVNVARALINHAGVTKPISTDTVVMACERGCIEITNFLIPHTNHVQRIFLTACYCGHLDVVKTILIGNYTRSLKLGTLRAAIRGYVDIVKFILDHTKKSQLCRVVWKRACERENYELLVYMLNTHPLLCTIENLTPDQIVELLNRGVAMPLIKSCSSQYQLFKRTRQFRNACVAELDTYLPPQLVAIVLELLPYHTDLLYL